MLPRPSHELLLVTIIQCLVVKFRADFHAAPPKILSPTQTLTLNGMTSGQACAALRFFADSPVPTAAVGLPRTVHRVISPSPAVLEPILACFGCARLLGLVRFHRLLAVLRMFLLVFFT